MNNDKKGLYSLITLITLIITQIILRSIGIDNMSVYIIVAVLVIACALVIFGTYKNINGGLGAKYNIIVAILMVLTSISSGIMMIMIKWYPDLFDKYDFLILGLDLISFFSLGLFIIIYRIIYELKQRK